MAKRSFSDVLEEIGRSSDKGERAIRAATARPSLGRDYSPSELLALQSDVYRFSEVVDLSTRFVDRVSNAAKTVLSGQ